MSQPVSIAAAKDRARLLFERRGPEWAATGGADAVLGIPLHPPTEQAALADLPTARDWVQSWADAEAAGGIEVQWAVRKWSRVGSQNVPLRLQISGPQQIARFAGRAQKWRDLSERLGRLREITGPSAAATLRSVARRVVDLEQSDFLRLLDVLAWLGKHPDSGLLVRELPIRGVDTKWIQTRRGLVTALHQAATGRPSLGLRDPEPVRRMRVLDPALAVGGLRDISAPVSHWAALDYAPERVFVVENLSTLLAMPDLPGAVVLEGGGYSVDVLARIPWAQEVTYWGDLDSDGFGILNRLRAAGVKANSVLMDRATLAEHLDLCVVETKPFTAPLTYLTTEEEATLSLLSVKGNLRLEQERIPWDYAHPRLG